MGRSLIASDKEGHICRRAIPFSQPEVYYYASGIRANTATRRGPTVRSTVGKNSYRSDKKGPICRRLMGRTLIAHQSDRKGPILDVRIACEAGGSLTSLYEVLMGRILVVHHS